MTFEGFSESTKLQAEIEDLKQKHPISRGTIAQWTLFHVSLAAFLVELGNLIEKAAED